MTNVRLLSLAYEHRRELIRLNNLALREWLNILRYARDEQDDSSWARLLRQAFPVLVREYAAPAAQLSAAFYDTTREQWVQEYGVKKVASFAAAPSAVMAVQDQLIDGRLRELGFHINSVFEGRMNRNQVSAPSAGLLTATVGDHSRVEQKILSETDSFSKGTKRVVRGTGCEFCRFSGWIEWQKDTELSSGTEGFHPNCSCVEVSEFEGGDDRAFYQPWMDEFGDKVEQARQQLWDSRNDAESKTGERGRDKKNTINRNNILSAIREIENA